MTADADAAAVSQIGILSSVAQLSVLGCCQLMNSAVGLTLHGRAPVKNWADRQDWRRLSTNTSLGSSAVLWVHQVSSSRPGKCLVTTNCRVPVLRRRAAHNRQTSKQRSGRQTISAVRGWSVHPPPTCIGQACSCSWRSSSHARLQSAAV
jgi:hypothetical protein